MDNKVVDEIVEEFYFKNVSSCKLMERYGLQLEGKKRYIYQFLPPSKTDLICEVCGEPVYYIYPSKSMVNMYNGLQNVKQAYRCMACGHQPYVDYCNCKSCNEKRIYMKMEEEERVKREQEIKQYKIKQFCPYPNVETCLEFNSISPIDERILVGVILKETLDETMSYAKSYHKTFKLTPYDKYLLTPSKAWDDEIYREIVPKYFSVSAQSGLDLFEFKSDEDEEQLFYKFLDVDWYPEVLDIIKYKRLGTILDMPVVKGEDEITEIYCLWKRILLEELVQDYVWEMEDSGFYNVTIGEKTKQRLAGLCDRMPLSKLFSIIYSTTARAAKWSNSRAVSKRHAANSVIGNTESYVDRAVEEGWEIRDAWRKKECPQSAVSKYFFKYVIPIGDDSIHMIPNMQFVKDIYQK